VTANKCFYSLVRQLAAIDRNRTALFLFLVVLCVLVPKEVRATQQAPDWMHTAAVKPLPSYNEKADAVQLYSETTVSVVSRDKIRTRVREAYKILRPEGRHHGVVEVYTMAGRRSPSCEGGAFLPAAKTIKFWIETPSKRLPCQIDTT